MTKSLIAILALGLLQQPSGNKSIQLRTALAPNGNINPQFARELPGANFLFFPSEDVSVRVQLYNEHSDLTLTLPEAIEAQLHVTQLLPDRRRSLDRTEWTSSRPVVTAPGWPDQTIHDGSPFVLPNQGTISWTVSVSRDLAAPADGVIAIGALPAVHCQPSCVVQPGGDFYYELRTRIGLEERLEILYRKALRARFEDDYNGADAAVNELLALHPSSVCGYYVRAEIAVLRGRNDRALESLDTATAIIASRSDWVLTRPSLIGSAHGLPEAVRMMREHLRRYR